MATKKTGLGRGLDALLGPVPTLDPVAKSPAEILKVAVTSDWKYGLYLVTRQRFRKINGTVLWHDTDGDGVCRFVTYKFVSDHAGGRNWTPLRMRAFCNGCAEGDVRCPK